MKEHEIIERVYPKVAKRNLILTGTVSLMIDNKIILSYRYNTMWKRRRIIKEWLTAYTNFFIIIKPD